ncbi:MAG: M20/M25/M40 family metallo-hydrolase [Pyrinomonadaceae bacterium]
MSIYCMRPPSALPPDAPPHAFSAGRALNHVRAIAQNPHPVGSAEHDRARDYILAELTAQGFETAVSTATAFGPAQYIPFRAATVQNITGRLRGTSSGTSGGKAVMLVAHYDSVPTGPGASDDAAAVAALLETARALKAGPPLKNDVVILLTDGEELGLLGASAFVDERGGAGDVGVVFNFEARGTSGQSVMFETSDQNGWLIREFAEASPAPAGNSMMYEIYRLLPNDTDFSPFKRKGFAGLNFAYIKDLPRYHSMTDNIQNLDADSLQHHGVNALALARHFGNLDFDGVKAANAVYFNPLGSTFVHYDGRLVIPLALFTLLAFAGVVALGFRKRLLTWRGILAGCLALLVSGGATYVAIRLALWLVAALHDGEEFVPWGDTYNSSYYILALVSLTCAVVFAVYVWFLQRVRLYDLALGGLSWWLVLALLSSVYLPGGSYLFVWPLVFALAGLVILYSIKGRQPAWEFIVIALSAAPGLLLLVPMIYTLFTALTFNAAGLVLLLLVLLFVPLISALDAATAGRKWLAPAAVLSLGVAFLVAGLINVGFDANHPKTSSVFYGLNSDSGQAVWASFDPRPDEWTAQFFPAGARNATLTELIPTSNFPFLQSEAPVASLAPPELVLLGEESRGDSRLLRLRVTSPRRAAIVSLYPDASTQVVGLSINGKAATLDGGATRAAGQAQWGLQYYDLPQEGVELTLELKPSRPVRIRVTDRSYGLPQLPGFKPRPDYMMPSPSSPGEMTLVGKSFDF